jgi:glucuronate isomerase
LCEALRITHDYFAENGCIASDHGVEIPYGYQVPEEDANKAFKKAYANEPLSQEETVAYMSYVLNEVAELDAEKGWVFQLHIGAVRDIRDSLANQIGPDSGGDVSNHGLDFLHAMNPLLNRFDNRLKVVFYCLDPNHQSTLAAVSRAYGEKVNLGSAWWLNDSPIGMKRQLEYIGSVDVLMNFAGMVSDSRKILSYQSRNEMFRRVLCDVIGNMVEMQQMPLHLAEKLVVYLSYERPKELFGFGE